MSVKIIKDKTFSLNLIYLGITSFKQKIEKPVESVGPDKTARTMQANLGWNFTHMHSAKVSNNKAYIN